MIGDICIRVIKEANVCSLDGFWHFLANVFDSWYKESLLAKFCLNLLCLLSLFLIKNLQINAHRKLLNSCYHRWVWLRQLIKNTDSIRDQAFLLIVVYWEESFLPQLCWRLVLCLFNFAT